MNIKGLLLGSAAALASVGAAHAADAIVAASPEPMDYVRVCDAFGTGYFYIPGTETCLKIGGQLRYQIDWNSQEGSKNWNARMRGQVTFDTRTDTEYGALGSTTTFRSFAEGDYDGGQAEIDEAFITLGGFKVGYGYNWWDTDLAGETDNIGSNRLNMIGYDYKGDNLELGAFVEELSKRYSESGESYNANDSVGFDGSITYNFGPVKAWLLGGYDFHVNDGTLRLWLTSDIGPGTFEVAGLYSSGANAYYDLAKWTVVADYDMKVTDKFSIIPGFQYWKDVGYGADGNFNGGSAYRAGVTLDYKITEGLAAKVTANYNNTDASGWAYADGWDGFLRLQRDF
ncbi:MAG: porin [Neorhizobium sp.]|jgi:hypothetical protein|nr:porin [Neorhizobium sp.]